MTNLDKIRAWAPDYPWAWSASQAGAATGVNPGKACETLRKAEKYGIVEFVDTFYGQTWWRLPRAEGAPEQEPVYHDPPCPTRYIRTLKTRRDRLASWVRALPAGTRFFTGDAVAYNRTCDAPMSNSGVINVLRHMAEVEELPRDRKKAIEWRRI